MDFNSSTTSNINKNAELYKNFLYRHLKADKPLESSHIDNLINKCREELKTRANWTEKYNAEDTKISKKKMNNPLKVCSKIHINYRKEIVDQVVDYLLGAPLSFSYENKELQELINDFVNYNDLNLLNVETLTDISASSVAYRLLYIDENKEFACINLPNDSVITLDNRNGVAEYAFYFYSELDETGENEEQVCEFYDETHYYIFRGDSWTLTECNKHGFNKMPIIMAYNNRERKPDFYHIETLADSIDELVSTHQDEIQEFRNAYMVIRGAKLTQEVYNKIIETGAFEVPENANVEFLTKDMDSTAVHLQREVLVKNLYKISKTVDMEKFSDSSESGESRKWKLILLENRAKNKIHIMKSFLIQMFAVLASAPKINRKGLVAEDILIQFNRSLPIDERYIGEYLNLYSQFCSLETLLARVPFVDNPKLEKEKRLEEVKAGLWGDTTAGLDDNIYNVPNEADKTDTSKQINDVKGVDTTIKETTK